MNENDGGGGDGAGKKCLIKLRLVVRDWSVVVAKVSVSLYSVMNTKYGIQRSARLFDILNRSVHCTCF